MYKRCIFIGVLIITLIAGCTGQQKTKEGLLNDGIKLARENDHRRAIISFKNSLEKDQNFFEARFQLVKSLNAIGNFAAAEKELEKVRRQNPSSRDIKIELAKLMVYTKRPDDALRGLAEYLDDTSKDCDALHIAGWAYAVKEEYTVAISLLKRAVAACGTNNTTPQVSIASVNISMGQLDAAYAYLAQILTKEPQNKKALYLLADVYIRRKDHGTAIKTLDSIIQADSGDIEAQYQKGMLFVENGNYDDALALSQTMTKKFPERMEGHRLQGFARFFKKQYSDALAPLQKALLQQPNAGTYYILGLTHYYRNEIEQAMNQMQKALDLQPSFTNARAHLALLLLSKGRTDDAIREGKKALSDADNNAFAHNILGSAYLAKGNYADGISELNRALALDPSLTNIHVTKGLLAMKRGMGREAESELTAAVRLKPEAQDSRRILALYYLNHHQPAKAIEVLKKGIEGGRADAVLYYLMAESYFKLNNINEAKAHFKKTKDLDPKYDLAYFRLASIYFLDNKQEEGIKELLSLVEKSPDNVPALVLLAAMAELNGDETQARKTYLKAAETKRTEGIIATARYLIRTNDSEQALKIINEVIDRSSGDKDTGLLEIKGNILLTKKKYKDALKTFEAMDQRKPGSGFGYLINTYLAMGDNSRALEKIRAEIRKNPTALGLRAELSRIYLRTGNKAEAVANANDMIRNNPESAIGYMALATIYQNINEVKKAIDTLRGASRIKDARISFMLGNLYAVNRDFAAALEQFRNVEKLKVGSDQAIFQKATIMHAMGQRREAEVEYQRILQMSPNHAMALNNLANVYIEENRSLNQALLYAGRAFLLEPHDDNIRDTLGYAYIKNGKTDQGVKILKKALENSPNNPNILYHLAIAYHENGDAAKAIEKLQKALAMGDFPGSREAKALFEKIKKNGKT